MWPVIKPDEIVFVKEVSYNTISPGDSIVYRIDNNYFLHRVISKRNSRVGLRGRIGLLGRLLINDDTNTMEPVEINREDIVGKLVCKGLFSRGVSGLIFCYLNTLLFKIIRNTKKILNEQKTKNVL